eukprot:Gb_08274 [translate_table: standard]
MGKGLVVLKLRRSDEVMDAKYQLKMPEQVKSKFEELAPKHPKKPDRSKFYDKPDFFDPFYEGEVPELKKFEQLECQSEPSNGFIKLECDGGSYFRLAFQENGMERIPIRSNPATNDWIPSHQAMVIPVSSKPTHSD